MESINNRQGTINSRCESDWPAFHDFILTRFRISSIEEFVCHSVGPHFVRSELPDGIARRLARELVRFADCLDKFHAGRGCNEVHRPAHLAEDAHVHCHYNGMIARCRKAEAKHNGACFTSFLGENQR